MAAGRASVHVTTLREEYRVEQDDADLAAYVVRPVRDGALPVVLLPTGPGWSLLPGDGPALEFWAGTDDDLEETRHVVRAVWDGRYRYAYEQRMVLPLIARWRRPRINWLCTDWIGDEMAAEHWNSPPDRGEPLEIRAYQY